ncbi:MAG: polysaccharide biosynthesis/export family protein [Rhodobacterales bacterium]|nr:polysaccharide biosynthesis/export family protein [Rhodobacterales bacterium]MDX5412266.1 polysaccharide biosynthesis/export family protein [Rhodobacterales bacterium]
MSTRDFIIKAFLILCFWSGTVAADTYTIDVGDRLELRVLEWQPVENRVLEWESMRAEMEVDTEGMVNVPFLGQLEARLLSPAQLSDQISAQLQDRFAISNSLDASVQVLNYRPVYVTGAVRSPGEYPFRPGLTAAQLIAQAAQASSELDTQEILNREGTIALLRRESTRLAIRRAMLKAAIEEREAVAPPPGVDAETWDQEVVEGENEVLRLRQQIRARELAALDDQIELLRTELEALKERATAQERLLESAQRDYDNVQSLADGGLAIGTRVAESERNLMLSGSQLLNISTAMLEARQGISLAEAEKVALRDRQSIEDTRELQRVEGELESVLTKLKTQQRISLAESGLALLEGGDGAISLTVTITRQGPDGTLRLKGEETVLAPGDVVHVDVPALRANGLRNDSGTPTQ